MATTPRSTLVTKAQELMKSQGLSYADAAKQARATITPTPTVNPVAPTPPTTPTPTPQTPVTPPPVTPTVNTIDNKQELLQSTKWLTLDQRRAVMQNQASTTPNVADQTPAPVTPTVTPPTTPTQPVTPPVKETVTPVKTEVKATTPEVNFNTSVGRENEINANLANITAGNQSLLTDRNAFNNAFGYATADDGKKALLDSFFQSKQAEITNPDTLYKTILSGAVIPESLKNTPNYKTALQRANNYKKFTSYSPTQLETSLLNGDLLPWTQIYNDLYNDPTMKTKLDQAKQINQINGKSLNVEEAGIKKTSELMNWPLAAALSDNYLTQEEKDSLINTAEVKAAATKLQEEKLALNELEQAYKNVDIEVDNEYKGRWLTSSQIAQIKANRRKDLAPDLELARENYATNYGFYTELKTNALNLFADNLSLYKEQKAQQEQIASEERQYQNALRLDQAKFEQSIKQQAEAMNNPTFAISSVIKKYEDQGIFAQKSATDHIAEFTKQNAQNGTTLGQYISKMQKDFQEKPEFKAKFTGNLNDTQKLLLQSQLSERSDIRNFNQQIQLAKINQDLDRQNFLWQIQNDPEKRARAYELEQNIKNNMSLFDILWKNVGTYEWNRWYDLAGKLWDPLPAGWNWTVKSVDTAWEFGVPYIAWTKKPYGNTVVMQDENGNEIRYSHLDTIGVKPWDVLSFGDIVWTRWNTWNVKWANWEILSSEQLKSGRGSHVDIEIKNSNWKLLSQSEQVNFLKSLKAWNTNITDKQFTQFNQIKTGFKSEPIVKSFEEALVAGWDIIQSLWSANWPWDVGAVFNFMKSLDPTSTVREWEFALAAKSAWVWESFKNIPANKLEGTILTDKQRKDFWKLAMKYIESKWKLYDTKYNDMVKLLDNQWIPKIYYPTRMTDYINQYKWAQTQATSNDTLWIR